MATTTYYVRKRFCDSIHNQGATDAIKEVYQLILNTDKCIELPDDSYEYTETVLITKHDNSGKGYFLDIIVKRNPTHVHMLPSWNCTVRTNALECVTTFIQHQWECIQL
jgi:hypothetical protein